MSQSLIEEDLKFNWHPCMQMKDFESMPPLVIKRAFAEYLYDYNNKSYVDATSSWWCKSLGHSQPRLQKALTDQLEHFEHVIFGNTTHDVIVNLSKKLVAQTNHCNRVFYASDGSCAVEIAIKMSMQAQQLRNMGHRTKLAALQGGYHGETILTLGVSDCELYSKPFESLLPDVTIIAGFKSLSGVNDESWHNDKVSWQKIEAELDRIKDDLCCIVFEPILQGAYGMRIYSPDFLRRLALWAQANNVFLIADEIMTGFMRTGEFFAYQHAKIEPDFICLGKGLTGGMLPMSAVLTRESIYSLFYDDYSSGKAFMHSHTHSGNALAAAVAIEAIDMTLEIKGQVANLSNALLAGMQEVLKTTGGFNNFRSIGCMVAADLINPENIPRLGVKLAYQALKYGVLLRPLGNTIYWLPPLNSNQDIVSVLKNATIQAYYDVMSS